MQDPGLAAAQRRSCFAEGQTWKRRPRPKRGKKQKELELIEDIKNHKAWFHNPPAKQQRQRELPRCFLDDTPKTGPECFRVKGADGVGSDAKVPVPAGGLNAFEITKAGVALGKADQVADRAATVAARARKNREVPSGHSLTSAPGQNSGSKENRGAAIAGATFPAAPGADPRFSGAAGGSSVWSNSTVPDVEPAGGERAAAEPLPADLLARDDAGGVVFRLRRAPAAAAAPSSPGDGSSSSSSSRSASEARMAEARATIAMCLGETKVPAYRPTLLEAGPPCVNLSSDQLARLRTGLAEFVPLPPVQGRYKLPGSRPSAALVDRFVPRSTAEQLAPCGIETVLSRNERLSEEIAAAVSSGELHLESALRVAHGFGLARSTFDAAQAEIVRGVAAALAAADADAECAALSALGTVSWSENMHYRAMAYDSRLAMLALKDGDKLWECVASFNLGCGKLAIENLDHAVSLFTRAEELARAVGAHDLADIVDTNLRATKKLKAKRKREAEEKAAKLAKAKAKKEKEKAMMRR